MSPHTNLAQNLTRDSSQPAVRHAAQQAARQRYAVRPLPTLLGALILLAGMLALLHSHAPAPAPPHTVSLEPLPTKAFHAVLLQQTSGEVRSREVELRAADTPAARLGATLRALKQWLGAPSPEGLSWPRQLGAPRVFWLGAGRAALDFPLGDTPHIAVATELRLLESIRKTAARQGVDSVFILVNGRVPPTFLGQVALPQVLE